MKRIFPLLFFCFLLCACTEEAVSPSDDLQIPYPQNGLFSVEENGPELQSTVLPPSEEYRLFCIKNAPILVSLNGNTAVFTRFEQDNLVPVESYRAELPGVITEDWIRMTEDGIQYRSGNQLVLLNTQLKEIGRIALPEDCCSVPLLSKNQSVLYYCTEDSLCVLDRKSDLSRTIRELKCSGYTILQLCFGEEAVLLRKTVAGDSSGSVLLSTGNGQTLWTENSVSNAFCFDQTLICHARSGSTDSLIFGSQPDALWSLTPRIGSHFLTVSPSGKAVFLRDNHLELYSFATGRRTASQPWPPEYLPAYAAASDDGKAFFLSMNAESLAYSLTVWNPTGITCLDSANYTGLYSSAEKPDAHSLEQCSIKAATLSKTYGVNIRIGENASTIQPWDYYLETEYRPAILRQELEILESVLNEFPGEFLSNLSGSNTPVNICLVKSIRGTAESGSLDTAEGLQFRDGNECYVALAESPALAHNLYHEFSHLIDTKVISTCNLYDSWNSLNPEGFSYFNGYCISISESQKLWLQGETRAFIDAYSMSFPAEDRARIMEYAMEEGNEAFFESETMQNKLRRICLGIRTVFDLKKERQIFRWEQYLWNSLSYRE